MAAKKKKTWKMEMWAVYSMWGYHAFYQTESIARKDWKGSKKLGIEYQFFPVKLEVKIAPNNQT